MGSSSTLSKSIALVKVVGHMRSVTFADDLLLLVIVTVLVLNITNSVYSTYKLHNHNQAHTHSS